MCNRCVKRTTLISTISSRPKHVHPGLSPRFHPEQDASRARASLDGLAVEHGLRSAARYVENESTPSCTGPSCSACSHIVSRATCFSSGRLDRLPRLTSPDWLKLRSLIDAKQVRIVALDPPTSGILAAPTDEFTGRMFAAVNAMMLDFLAAVARKDYEDPRRLQVEETAKAMVAGLYKARPENKIRNAATSTLPAMAAAGAIS